jgi:ribosome biogenesis GTPase A
MNEMNIQWYPWHMAKTKREIKASLKLVDAVIELLDARIPVSSRNPDLAELTVNKPRLIVLNRRDLADPNQTGRWAHILSKEGAVLETDAKSGYGCDLVRPALERLLREKLDRQIEKGQKGEIIRAMVLGIPNVGKSSFINRISRSRSAHCEWSVRRVFCN